MRALTKEEFVLVLHRQISGISRRNATHRSALALHKGGQRRTKYKDIYWQDVDLIGVYYDVGNNVKFGFPWPFPPLCFLGVLLTLVGEMKGKLQNAKEAICWGTSYLLKGTAHQAPFMSRWKC